MPAKPRRRGILHRLLLTAVLLVGTAGCVADMLVLGSSRGRVDPVDLRREVVRSQGRTVECWTARSPGGASKEPEAFVLFFVGKSDRAERWTEAVAGGWGEYPVEVWGMNYPGSGGSTGPARLDRVAPAALAVFDAMSTRAGGRPIFAHAASFGTTPALAVAARRPLAGLVLENPPPLRQLILGHHGWWNLWVLAGLAALQVPADLDSIANARRATAPAIFILHGADEVVPPNYQRRVVDAYAGPKRVIPMPGARHADALTREAAAGVAEGREWMWRLASSAAARSHDLSRKTGRLPASACRRQLRATNSRTVACGGHPQAKTGFLRPNSR